MCCLIRGDFQAFKLKVKKYVCWLKLITCKVCVLEMVSEEDCQTESVVMY